MADDELPIPQRSTPHNKPPFSAFHQHAFLYLACWDECLNLTCATPGVWVLGLKLWFQPDLFRTAVKSAYFAIITNSLWSPPNKQRRRGESLEGHSQNVSSGYWNYEWFLLYADTL
jgi:hypothetical protein